MVGRDVGDLVGDAAGVGDADLVGDGAGVGADVGFGDGTWLTALLIIIPLFQINFLPDLMQVNFLP
jgi:hypothetical protein